ncbi:MAG: serine/threonine-protein kinase [Rubrivivax sp.]
MADAIEPADWARLSPLLDELLDLAPPERAQRLAALRADNAPFAQRLAELLAFVDEETGPTEPAPPGAAALLAPHAGSGGSGRVVGAWTLERELGAGGMGSVWLARRSDGRFEGVAAVKLPHLALLGPGGRRRFARETQALARLSHPHIAALKDAGITDDGQPYLVLEHVAGPPIDTWCDERRLGVRERVELVIQMLDAVAHAHAQLVLHRDLKPANVLVTDDGSVKLLDFGIARLLEAGEDAADAGQTQRLFTPDCAAPEQVEGGSLGTATDVYAAGVLLFQLLVDAHPTAAPGATRHERLQSVLQRDARPLAEAAAQAAPEVAARRGLAAPALARALRGDLSSIVAKALEKRPADRYPDARALADDLRRHLRHQPVLARPASLAYHAARFVRRHRGAVAAGLALTAALLAGVAGTAWQAERAARERDHALALARRNASLVEFFGSLLTQAAQDERPITVPELLARSRELAKRAVTDPETDANVLLMLAGITVSLGDASATAALLDDAGQRLGDDASRDPALRAELGCSQAFVASLQGRRDEAGARFAQAMPLAERAGPASQSDCLLRRAYVAQNHNDAKGALADAEQALALIRRSPTGTPLSEARALGNVAYGHYLAGHTAQADATYAETMKRLRALGRGDTPEAVTFLNNWGIASFAAGDIPRAHATYDEALAIAGRLAPQAPLPFYLLRNRALALLDLARHDAALADLRRAHADALAGGNPMNAGIAGIGIAQVQLERGERDAAHQTLDEARRLFGPQLPPDSMPAVTLKQFAAREALLAGRAAEARDGFTRVIDFFESRGMRVAPVVTALRSRADALRQLGDLGAAAADLDRALTLARTLQGDKPYSSHVGRTLAGLYPVLLAQGRTDEARRTAAQAAAALERALGADHPDTRRAREAASAP